MLKRLISHSVKNRFHHFENRKNIFKRYLQDVKKKEIAQITKLDNNITVATRPFPNELSAIGTFIMAGSRYSTEFPKGITHIIKRMGFTGSNKFNSADDIANEINKCQGITDCQSARDLMIYAIMLNKNFIDSAVEILAESTIRPNYTSEALDITKRHILAEIEHENYEPEPEHELADLRHKAAFGDFTLGIPERADVNSIDDITLDTLNLFHQKLYTPQQTFICGINTDHEMLCDSILKHFDYKNSLISVTNNSVDNDCNHANYTGGLVTKILDQPRVQPGHAEFPELAHIGVGFKGFSFTDKDLFGAYVIHGILGSGRSFSSGGPGKGLLSRLNKNVLGRYYWVNSCISEVLAYKDTGLFYIYGSCDPPNARDFLDVILEQYYSIITSPISAEELSRAKKQVLSLALSCLEQKSVMLEDLGRNVYSSGSIIDQREIIENLEKITVDDVKRIADKILSSPPSIYALGQIKDFPDYTSILDSVSKATTTQKRMFHRFFK